jgi:hypothetical protein
LEELAALRRNPGGRFQPAVTAGWLKTQDEHSMTALLAVTAAIRQYDLHDANFSEWGVVTASRFIGRRALLNSIERFTKDGPWGASLHVVPMHSPHSPAGALSLSLGSRGPNLSTGSAVGAVAEAVLIAASMLTQQNLPGLWLVLTEWERDIDEADSNDPSRSAVCHATAFAIRPTEAASDYANQIGHLTVHGPTSESLAQEDGDIEINEAALKNLLKSIVEPRSQHFSNAAPLSGGLRLSYCDADSFGKSV